MADKTRAGVKVKVEKLESGMIVAENVHEPYSRRVLLLKNTRLDSVMIFNLKERYHIKYIRVKKNIGSFDVTSHIKAELDVNESLSALKGVFGTDTDETITELSEQQTEEVDVLVDDILDSLYDDDNLLLKMHQLQTYDDYTYKHCLRVAMLSVTIGKKMDLSKEELKELCQAALLHDIGKRMISIDIIRKPDKLTEEEYKEVKKHPANGYYLLKKTGGYSVDVMNAVLMHQEKFDGSGYPLGISGDAISLLARIITVADVYDALTSNRPYREPWSVTEAEEFMLGSSGTHFDYDVVTAFLAAFAPYPVGEKVRLSDGRVAVVMSNNSNVLRPTVCVKKEGGQIETIDLYNDFKYLSLTIVDTVKYDEEKENNKKQTASAEA